MVTPQYHFAKGDLFLIIPYTGYVFGPNTKQSILEETNKFPSLLIKLKSVVMINRAVPAEQRQAQKEHSIQLSLVHSFPERTQPGGAGHPSWSARAQPWLQLTPPLLLHLPPKPQSHQHKSQTVKYKQVI